MHSANFFYHAFLEPSARKLRRDNFGKELTERQSTYLILSYVLELLLQLSIYVASALQLLLLLSESGKHCTVVTEELKIEGNWLLALSIA